LSFSESLRREASPLWQKTFDHPFVRGIGDGTLPRGKFRYYLRQDYVFLIDYGRVLALALAKAGRLSTMRRLAELLKATLGTEMALHQAYAAEFGISLEDLERTQPAPTTQAYTRHLLCVAYGGEFADIAAALLPCQWGYAEVGARLAAQGRMEGNPYAQWIRTYASPEFRALADWLRGVLDPLGEELGPSRQREVREHFLTSSRYEYLFWEMAYREEAWPL
jgi:thiaminase/transcriptional activator TenA